MSKKILAIVLALVMCLSLVPVTATAADGHIHDDITFEPWATATKLPTGEGDYYLTDNVTLSETWTVPAGKTVNLCLNGFVIKYAGETNDSVIKVPEGATLNLYDCDTETEHHFKNSTETDGLWVYQAAQDENTAHTVTGGVITGGNANNEEINQFGGGVFVNGGTFNMYGGSIVGNIAYNGGGVAVCNVGNFTMEDGSIVGNVSILNDSGGVHVARESDGTESSFTMNGGSIASNTVISTGIGGGGVGVCGSFIMNGGSIVDNAGGTCGGGVRVFNGGVFTMNGGSITGNSGGEGGGVYANQDAVFLMEGGGITGNAATSTGGGVYVYQNAVFAMAGGSIIGNTANENGGGVYVYYNYQPNYTPPCLAEGSLITMANGERMPVEELEQGDMVRVFDHESGEPSTAPIGFVVKRSKPLYGAFTLHFSGGIDVTPVSGRAFYEQQENRYVILNDGNAEDYIGHAFYDLDADCWRTLDSVTHIAEPVTAYALVTKDVLNCAATGMLSCEDSIVAAFADAFAFDTDMKVDQVQKQADIQKWGLATHEEYDCISGDFFEAFPFCYANIVIGKGLATAEEIKSVATFYCQLSGYADAPAESKMTLLKAPVLTLFSEPNESVPGAKINDYTVKSHTTDGVNGGIILGGTAKIYGNDTENVYLKNCEYDSDGEGTMLKCDSKITIGTGLDGNGVIAPAPGMAVYVTNDPNATDKETICLGAAEGDEQYFFADDDTLYVVFDNMSTLGDTSDDVLKLGTLGDKHKVIVSQSEGGTIYTDKQAAAEEPVTLTVIPQDGYQLKSLTVNSSTDGITDKGDGKYEFTMSNANVTVTAVFEEISEDDDEGGCALLHLLRAALVTKLTVCSIVCGVTSFVRMTARIAAAENAYLGAATRAMWAAAHMAWLANAWHLWH